VSTPLTDMVVEHQKPLLDRIQSLEEGLKFYASRENWRSDSTGCLRVLDPEFVSSKLTGGPVSGIEHGWEVAEHVLRT